MAEHRAHGARGAGAAAERGAARAGRGRDAAAGAGAGQCETHWRVRERDVHTAAASERDRDGDNSPRPTASQGARRAPHEGPHHRHGTGASPRAAARGLLLPALSPSVRLHVATRESFSPRASSVRGDQGQAGPAVRARRGQETTHHQRGSHNEAREGDARAEGSDAGGDAGRIRLVRGRSLQAALIGQLPARPQRHRLHAQTTLLRRVGHWLKTHGLLARAEI